MKVTLENWRLAFAAGVFKATKGEGEGEPAFNCKFIAAPNHKDIKKLEAAIEAVAKEKWGTKWAAILKGLKAENKTPLHDGDLKSQWDGFEGNMYVNARSKTKPSVRDRQRNDIEQDSGLIYSGVRVYGYIELWAQDNKFGKRINATLRGVQHFEHADAFAGGGSGAADAEEMADLSTEDETIE